MARAKSAVGSSRKGIWLEPGFVSSCNFNSRNYPNFFGTFNNSSYLCSNIDIVMNNSLEDKLAYIIAVVNEFAAAFSLNPQQAYRYLDRFKGIDFVDKFYNVEHTQPFEDVVEDLALHCRNNGGALA